MKNFRVVAVIIENHTRIELHEVGGVIKYKCAPALSDSLKYRIGEILKEDDFLLEISYAGQRWIGVTYQEYFTVLSKNKFHRNIIVSEEEYTEWITPYAVLPERYEARWEKLKSDLQIIMNRRNANVGAIVNHLKENYIVIEKH